MHWGGKFVARKRSPLLNIPGGQSRSTTSFLRSHGSRIDDDEDRRRPKDIITGSEPKREKAPCYFTLYRVEIYEKMHGSTGDKAKNDSIARANSRSSLVLRSNDLQTSHQLNKQCQL